MRVLGVIPARGGSKGLPRKNVLPLAGVPLIAWTIAAAKAAELLTDVIVSTDDDEIAEVARAHGAYVPFVRPADLATDSATSMGVVGHALQQMIRFDQPGGKLGYDAVCLLQPTSPFRAPQDIVNAVKLLVSSGAPSVISVSPLEHPVAWTVVLGGGNRLELPLLKGIPGAQSDGSVAFPETQRQSHATAYRLNGAVYVYHRETVLNHPTGLLPDTRAYVMGEFPGMLSATIRGIDIDTASDLALAEAIARGLNLRPA